ncbi:MAG: serine/threonine-protein kinase, partial [Myxococcota bacterium]
LADIDELGGDTTVVDVPPVPESPDEMRALVEADTEVAQLRLPEPGDTIHERYLVERKLGNGRFGWVFLVRHTMLQQSFAMKLLAPRVSNDPNWIERFSEEARLTSLIGHPHIVFVTDLGRCPIYGYYYVMEYLDGHTLQHTLKADGAMSLERAVTMALGAADALGTMHQLGIVHRDIKPSNLMLVEREDGSELTKLLDFGISTHVIDAAATRKIYGTPAYIAPEQTRSMDVDHRADQFALACVLYEALTGQRPWITRDWRMATPRERRKQQVRPPSTMAGGGLGAELDAVILRALEISPEARWPSIDAFAYALSTAAGLGPLTPSVGGPEVGAKRAQRKSGNGEEATLRAPAQLREDSMVIVVEDDDLTSGRKSVQPGVGSVSLGFRTPKKLEQEWETNLKKGVVFVPTRYLAPIHAPIKVHLVYEPQACGIDVCGTVVAHKAPTAEHDGGFGVSLEPDTIAQIEQFIAYLGIDNEYGPDDVVEMTRSMRPNDDLSAGEAFLLSRLAAPARMREVRAMFSGLPFDVEEVLATLARKNMLRINGATMAPRVAAPSSLTSPSMPDLEHALRQCVSEEVSRDGLSVTFYDDEKVSQVLERVEFLKSQNDHQGAIDALGDALDASPTVAEFYRQLALLHASFTRDFDRALRAIENAQQLAPHNRAIQHTSEYVTTLAKRYG